MRCGVPESHPRGANGKTEVREGEKRRDANTGDDEKRRPETDADEANVDCEANVDYAPACYYDTTQYDTIRYDTTQHARP